MYNGFGIILAQCLSHIQRYIKGVAEATKHTGATLMKNFFNKCCNLRNELIANKQLAFEKNEYDSLMKEYDNILSIWKHEWMYSSKNSNPVYDDERKFLSASRKKIRTDSLFS